MTSPYSEAQTKNTCHNHYVWFDNFRARAEAVYGDIWADDPACYLTDEEISGPMLGGDQSSEGKQPDACGCQD